MDLKRTFIFKDKEVSKKLVLITIAIIFIHCYFIHLIIIVLLFIILYSILKFIIFIDYLTKKLSNFFQ
jgi:hypothetical protein